MDHATSVHPIIDLTLWARFALGSAVVLWLPGYLLVGRHLKNRALPQRAILALAGGAFILPLFAQATSLAAIGVRPWQYLPVVLVATAALGRTQYARTLGRALDRREPDAPWVGPALVIPTLVGVVVLALSFHDFVVPPTTHDAANHAFMTLRISEVGTVQASQVFGAPFGRPDLPYALGLHAIASMIAQTTGLAPYVAVWFLSLSAVALIPVSLCLLWDDWEMDSKAIVLGALFVAASPYAPGRVLWWGLFGTAAGLFLVPILSLLLARFWSAATLGSGITAGAAAGSLMLIHGSEVPTAGFVTLVTLAITRRRPDLSATGWLAFLFSMILSGSFFLITVAPSYLGGGIESGSEFIETLEYATSESLGVMGSWLPLQILGVLSLGLAFIDRRTRIVALFTLCVLAVATALALYRDPLTSLLTTPYYRQPERTRYQLVFCLPLVLGFGVHWLSAKIPTNRWSVGSNLMAGAAILLALIGPDLSETIRRHREKLHFAPFSADDYRQSKEIAALLKEDEWVANQFFDGSSWLLHLAGTPLLAPTGWQLTSPPTKSNRKILQDLIRQLRFEKFDKRFAYLYVSDLRTGKPRGFTRQRAARIPALEPVLVGQDSTLYRIRRDAR